MKPIRQVLLSDEQIEFVAGLITARTGGELANTDAMDRTVSEALQEAMPIAGTHQHRLYRVPTGKGAGEPTLLKMGEQAELEAEFAERCLQGGDEAFTLVLQDPIGKPQLAA